LLDGFPAIGTMMIDEHARLLVWFNSDIAYVFNADTID
jgi:hypothetical protein